MEAGRPQVSSLPNEIICYILKNLPVKSLLRCKCVCKEWNAIITGQSFINTRLLSQPQVHLLCHFFEPLVSSSSTSEKTQHCSFFSDESFSLVHKFEVPLPYSPQQFPCRILVGSLDGLLCLTDLKPFGRELHLWNPSIRKCSTLSNSCLFNENDHQRYFHPKIIAFGLGFCVHTSDHIIIRIVVFQSRSRKSKSNRVPQAEVYSFRSESWKKLELSEDVLKRLTHVWSRRYVNLHGDLNWIASFSDGEGREYESILSYDVNKGEFREIRLPSEYKNGIYSICLRIEVYRGSLAVIITGNLKPDDGSKYVWLWIMGEYGNEDSWTRTAVKKTGPRSLQGCYILDGRNRIMFKLRGRKGSRNIELLDMETREERQLWIPDFLSVHTFKEILVSLPTVVSLPTLQ